jgi:hypothetical protein
MARRRSTRRANDDTREPAPNETGKAMSANEERSHAAATGREGLATQLRELEEFVAKSEAAGEPLPPEALEMVARLREIVTALDGLTSSLHEE